MPSGGVLLVAADPWLASERLHRCLWQRTWKWWIIPSLFFLLNTSPRMRLLSILWNVSMLWWILHTHMDDVIKCVCGCFLSHLNEAMEVKYLQKVSTLSSAWANPVPGVCFFCKPVKQHQLLLHYQKPLLKCFETGHFLPALIAFQSQGQPPHDRSPQWTEYGRLFFLMNV